MILASALLAIVVALAFAVFLLAVSTLREATNRESRAKDVTAATLSLEKLVVDLESGLRGLILTGQPELPPAVTRARAAAGELAAFERLGQPDSQQRRRAQQISGAHQRVRDRLRAPAHGHRAHEPGRPREPGRRAATASSAPTRSARSSGSCSRARARARPRARPRPTSGRELAIVLGVAGARALRGADRPVRRRARALGRAAGARRRRRRDPPRRRRPVAPAGGGRPGRGRGADAGLQHDGGGAGRGRTELEEQNERLRQSEQLKSELVSIVSHEVRTPLASVLGFTSLLLHRDVDAGRARRLPRDHRRPGPAARDAARRLPQRPADRGGPARTRRAERFDLRDLLREQVRLLRARARATSSSSTCRPCAGGATGT